MILLLVAVRASAWAAPAAITPAEKYACEAAADYLARGPVAIWERLSLDSPFRALPKNDALREIEVRLGPSEGAAWVLRTSDELLHPSAMFEVTFASGVDDVVTFDLREDRGFTIHHFATLAEVPPPNLPLRKSKVVTSPEFRPPFQWWGIAAAVLLLIAGPAWRVKRVAGWLVTLAGVCALAVAAALAARPALTNPSVPGPVIALRSLLDLRRAMALGLPLPNALTNSAEANETAMLWTAEVATDGRRDAVPILEELNVLKGAPMVELLRARIAAARGQGEEASGHYAALNRMLHGPEDAFWFESSVVDVKAPTSFPDLESSRDAEAHYLMAMRRMAEGERREASRSFRSAWRLSPRSRADVIDNNLLNDILDDADIASLVAIHEPAEPLVAYSFLSRNPMRVPPSAQALALGALVRVIIGKAVLQIPGGAEIAPKGTEAVTTLEWKRREVASILADFPELVRSRLTSSNVQRRAALVVDVLGDENRWSDIVALTDSLHFDEDNVPLALLVGRAQALVKLKRVDDARRLVTARAVEKAVAGGRDPSSVFHLADVLASGGAYQEALDLYKRVHREHEQVPVVRALQLSLRHALAGSAPVVTTLHFEIHCMSDVPSTVAQRVGQLLEEELKRLQGTLTIAEFRPVRVNVLNWMLFSNIVTGSDDIVGIYDGEITIPFGAVEQFREEVVSTMTHELTHAIVSQASADNAPRWFQEGIARRKELVERQENIFQKVAPPQMPALSLLDPLLHRGTSNFPVRDAYAAAATFIRFLEDRHGSDALNRLIAEYRKGAGTDDAFVAVLQKHTPDLDREFRQWGITHAEAFIDRTPWPYMQYYSRDIDPKIRNAIRFSRRPKP